jgi:hypothetical protein
LVRLFSAFLNRLKSEGSKMFGQDRTHLIGRSGWGTNSLSFDRRSMANSFTAAILQGSFKRLRRTQPLPFAPPPESSADVCATPRATTVLK